MKRSLLLISLSAILVSVTGNAQTWTKIGVASPTTGWADVPSLTTDKNGNLYTAFNNFNGQLSMMKYNGSTWTTVGSDSISAGGVSTCGEPSPIVIDTAGMPYVAYPDTGAKATVMKFNGSSWVPVGATSFSAGQAVGLSMAIDNNNIPYVVYEELDTIHPGATVMKFDGTNWVMLGTGLSTGYANFTSIAIAPDGTPYIAFGDFNNGNKATVYKYTGGSWTLVGAADFSTGPALYTSLAIDKSGTPYVVYQDQGVLSGGATVMKYNGSSWVVVGTEGFSAGSVAATTIALDTNGTPYVSYEDNATPLMQATVMKYTGSAWVNVGAAGLSAGQVGFVPIAIGPDNTPYVAYSDTSTGNSRIAVMKFSAPTGITNLSNEAVASIHIFPDPNHGTFTLNVPSATKEDIKVSITNMAGQQVKQLMIPVNRDTQVQLQVAQGTYYLSALINSKQVVAKVVVE